jgi:hypothetical protein
VPSDDSDKPARLRVDAETTLILREAFHKIDANYRNDHYGLYDYARAVMSKIVPLDHFYIGFFHGANRVRYPYGYDGGMYTDPASHIYGPHGQAAWLLKHRQTYRMQYDNGAALNAGVASGDTSRASADAVTTPLFRRGRDGEPAVFGMMSMQSYRPDTFDDNAVRAFEWLADLVARVLTTEAEDVDALRRLPADVDDAPQLVTADHIVELLSSRVADIRQRPRTPSRYPTRVRCARPCSASSPTASSSSRTSSSSRSTSTTAPRNASARSPPPNRESRSSSAATCPMSRSPVSWVSARTPSRPTSATSWPSTT